MQERSLGNADHDAIPDLQPEAGSGSSQAASFLYAQPVHQALPAAILC